MTEQSMAKKTCQNTYLPLGNALTSVPGTEQFDVNHRLSGTNDYAICRRR